MVVIYKELSVKLEFRWKSAYVPVI